jgi:hypothetical protein
MKRIKREKDFFKRCQRSATVKKQIANATTKEIQSLCEVAKNVYKGNVQLPTRTVTRLRPYKKQLFHIGLKKSPLETKRRYIHRGGALFVPILATIASSLLASLLTKNG